MWRTFPGRGHKCVGSTIRQFYKHSHLSINNSGMSEAKGKRKKNETRSLPQSTADEQFLTKCYASGDTLSCGLET